MATYECVSVNVRVAKYIPYMAKVHIHLRWRELVRFICENGSDIYKGNYNYFQNFEAGFFHAEYEKNKATINSYKANI